MLPNVFNLYLLIVIVSLSCFGDHCSDKYGYLCYFKETCGKVPIQSGYITGGEYIQEGEFPFLVQVLSSNNKCSGVIVSDYHVLTAAHCFENGDSEQGATQVVVGTNRKASFKSNTRRFPKGYFLADEVCRHPRSVVNDVKILNDLAVVKLNRKIEFNDYVQPACWPLGPNKVKADGGNTCFQVGFGRDQDQYGNRRSSLKAKKMPIREVNCPRLNIRHNFICFVSNRRSSICSGDSGGPSLCLNQATGRWSLIGIASASFYELDRGDSCDGGSAMGAAIPDPLMAETISKCGQTGY